MIRDEYLHYLPAVPLFSHCSRRQLEEIATVADELTVASGTVIARQGDVMSELFVLVDGTASVTRDGQAVGSVAKGGFVGELAVLARIARTTSVTADTEMRLLVLRAAELNTLLDDNPGLATHLLHEVAARLAPMTPDHSDTSHHHSELSDPQLARLSDVLRHQSGATHPFSANEALSAALAAGVVNNLADIGTAIDDLEDAGVLRQVQKNPPRWEVVDRPS